MELKPIKLKGDFKMDEDINDIPNKIIRSITEQINEHNEVMIEIILNDALNKAFNSKDRIHGVVSSNKIAIFVNKYLSKISTLKKRSPHVLRHSFATHMTNNGAELNAVKELLGHASLAATQIYTHNSIEKLKEVYKKAHPKAE